MSVEDVVRELFKKQDQGGLPAKATERDQPETLWGRSFPSRGNGRAKALGCVDLVFPGTARGSVWPEGRGEGNQSGEEGPGQAGPRPPQGLGFYSVRRDWQRALTRGLMGTHVFISATVGAVELTSLTGVGLNRPSVLWLRPGLPVWLPTRPLLAPAWLGGPGTALPGPLICGLSHVHPSSPSLALYEPHYTLA